MDVAVGGTSGGSRPVAMKSYGAREIMSSPSGTLSSLGVFSGHLVIALEPFAAGLGDHKDDAYELFAAQDDWELKVGITT